MCFQAERLCFGVAGGWQDQYASAFGGFNLIEFDGSRNLVHPIRLEESVVNELEECLILCDTQIPHESGAIHKEQRIDFDKDQKANELKDVVNLCRKMHRHLIRAELVEFGRDLHAAWQLKRGFTASVTNYACRRHLRLGDQGRGAGWKIAWRGRRRILPVLRAAPFPQGRHRDAQERRLPDIGIPIRVAGRGFVANQADVKMNTFDIDGFAVGGESVFVIAEIGNNHNGSVELARKLVDAAIGAGANCVKFQLRNREALYRVRADGSVAEDLGVEYIQDLLNKVELTVAQHREIREYCRDKRVTYLCTPWDEPSVDVLATFDVPALKIASADLCNPYLIRKAASLGKPLILSTGMSFEHEIIRAIAQLNELAIPFALLHCNSTYPGAGIRHSAPLPDPIGSSCIDVVGYSGHERGTAITIAAVALGAKIVERHITLDRNMEGPDHLASLEPEEFRSLVEGIRQVEKALPWTGPGRHASQGELLNRENLAKSVIAARDIAEGETFSEDVASRGEPGPGTCPLQARAI